MKLNIYFLTLFCFSFFIHYTNSILGAVYPPPRDDAPPAEDAPPAPEEEASESPPPAEAQPSEQEPPATPVAEPNVEVDDDYDFTFGIDPTLRIPADHTVSDNKINYYPFLRFFKFYSTHIEAITNELKTYSNLTSGEKIVQVPFYRKLFELTNTFTDQLEHNKNKIIEARSGIGKMIMENDENLKILGNPFLIYRDKVLRGWIMLSKHADNTIHLTQRAIINIYNVIVSYSEESSIAPFASIIFHRFNNDLLDPLKEGETIETFINSIKEDFDDDIENKHLFDEYYKAIELINNFENSAKLIVEICAYKRILTPEEIQKGKELVDKIIESYKYLSNVKYEGKSNFMESEKNQKSPLGYRELCLLYAVDGGNSIPFSMESRTDTDENVDDFNIATLEGIAKIREMIKNGDNKEDQPGNTTETPTTPKSLGKDSKEQTDQITIAKKKFAQIKTVVVDKIKDIVNGSNDKTMFLLTLFLPIQIITTLLILT